MTRISPFRRILWIVVIGGLWPSAAPVATAAEAVYSVKPLDATPVELQLKIDTRPWPANRRVRTARFSVLLELQDGTLYSTKWDFLEGVTTPGWLEANQIYQRTLKLGVTGPVSIVSSSVTFPNDDDKADAAHVAEVPNIASPSTVVVGGSGVVIPPPPTAKLSFEKGWNRNGRDLPSTGTRAKSARDCSLRCLSERKCLAFTFVMADDGSGGACWLKSGVPPQSACENCTSGVKKL